MDPVWRSSEMWAWFDGIVYLDVGKRHTDVTRPAFPFERIGQGHANLRHSVAFQQVMTRNGMPAATKHQFDLTDIISATPKMNEKRPYQRWKMGSGNGAEPLTINLWQKMRHLRYIPNWKITNPWEESKRNDLNKFKMENKQNSVNCCP